MAEIAMTIDRGANLTVLTVTGALTVLEVTEQMRRHAAGQPTRYILWDLTAAQMGGLTASDVKVIVDGSRQYTHLRPAGRTALVAATDLEYGLGRMIEQSLSAGGSSVPFQTFRDRAAAEAWLTGG